MQEPSRPAMLERRLSRTACAVMLMFMALALFAFNLFCTHSGLFMPLWTSAVFEAVILLIPGVMLVLLCQSSVPHARLGFKRTALVIGMGATGYVFTLMLSNVWALVWTAVLSGNEVPVSGSLDLMETIGQTPLWALLLIIALAPALCEEYFFRGMLMKSMSLNPAAAVCTAAALFALMHYDLTKLYATFGIGLFIGWVVMRSGNLYAGMILHFMNNAFSVLVLKGMTVFTDVLGTSGISEQALYEAMLASPDTAGIVMMVMLGIILLFVLSIPLFFLCLILFLKDTRADAELVHEAALLASEAGEDRDVLGRILLIASAVLMTGVMLYSHGVFG